MATTPPATAPPRPPARTAGIELLTVPLRNESAPEVLVERVEVPRRLKQGEPFDLTAHIRSNVATTAKVKLYQNQFLIEQRDLELKPGDNEFRAPNLKADGSFISYEVEIVPALDTAVENNRATATASLRGQPRVLLVDADEAKAARWPTRCAARRSSSRRAATGLPKTLEDLQQFDLFLLSDVSALRLGREQMDLYRRWVQDFGGGFVMIGGENSYGVGGYYRTPIEQMLPVRMEHEDRQDTPSVAMLVVLDRSGSMTAQVAGQTKMSLADQGAVFAMNVLQPKDYFGVTAVDTRPHVVVPLAQIAAKARRSRRSSHHRGRRRHLHLHLARRGLPAAARFARAQSSTSSFSPTPPTPRKRPPAKWATAPATGGTSLDLASAMLAAEDHHLRRRARHRAGQGHRLPPPARRAGQWPLLPHRATPHAAADSSAPRR